jgi:uncharacterized NAD(P)/FAD-binding protein YdhS
MDQVTMAHKAPSPSGRRITIVGGGFSGVCIAIQLVRTATTPLAITLIEQQQRVGPGLAYTTADPDHRLNGPTWSHSVDPLDAGHFARWCEAHRIFERDPQALRPDGTAFARRGDYGDYLEDTLRSYATDSPSGSTITRLRDLATGTREDGDSVTTFTASGLTLESDLLILATGNALPKLQAPLDATLAKHPGVIENALDAPKLLGIPQDARVLLIGSGLTALDVLSTLLRQAHTGQMVVVSRRGLRPRPPSTSPVTPASGRELLDRILGPAPAFLTDATVKPTLHSWVRALRARIRVVQAQGGSWHAAFDDLRDSVWQLWPRLPTAQKRRLLKKMRTWYDVHRFRAPPQNDAIVNAAQAAGRVTYRAARLQAVTPVAGTRSLQVDFTATDGTTSHEVFDVIVNCTGLDVASRAAANPLLSALLQQGWLTPDDCGIGFAVDNTCRIIGADGQARKRVRLIGPPTLGTFGDPAGALYITAQIHRILPDILDALSAKNSVASIREEGSLSVA